MELKDIVLYVLVGALVVVELFKYLKRRSEGTAVEESGKISVDVFKDILEKFNDSIRDMSSKLRDSVSQEAFNDFLRYNEKLQNEIKDGFLYEISTLMEEYIKRVDHDVTNDPGYVPPTEEVPAPQG